jgi:hypothetical protein
VQVPARRGGGARKPDTREAYALTLSALGAVNRLAGENVKWQNELDDEGNPVAVVILPGAAFETVNGKTVLTQAQKESIPQ